MTRESRRAMAQQFKGKFRGRLASILEADVFDSVVHGCCEDCLTISFGHEPDAEANWCPRCKKHTVVSILIVAGIL